MQHNKGMFLASVVISTFAIASAAHGHAVDYERMAELCSSLPPAESLTADAADKPRAARACEVLLFDGRGGPDTHFYMGRLLHLTGDKEAALEHFRTGAEAGSLKADTALLHLQQAGVAAAPAAGSAEAQQDPVEQVLEALALLHDSKTSEEAKRQAQDLLTRASEAGYPVADYYLAEYYRGFYRGGSSIDPDAVVGLLQSAARGGVAETVKVLASIGKDTSAYGDPAKMAYPRIDPDYLVFWRP